MPNTTHTAERDLDRALATLHPRLRTCAVTGTNGKTSTTRMVAEIVAAAGNTPAWVTTTGSAVGGRELVPATDLRAFREVAAAAVDEGAPVLALEVTSRALEAGFAQRWPAQVAVFTNLSHDHLDRHGTPEAYLAAKARLFLALPAEGTAVLNRDDPAAALIAEVLPRAVRVAWYGARDADLALAEARVHDDGTDVALADSALARQLGGRLRLRTVGRVYALNALGAALAAHALGLPPAAIRAGLERFPGAPGRFQVVSRRPLVVVDYAHTPAALAATLATAQELARARAGAVHCVFGCGGERDADKRAPMGAIADQGCQFVWLTDDNPRGEDPEVIAEAVRGGAQGRARWARRADRREAVTGAIRAAAPADVVVIAGKGHEREQLRAGARLAMDDVSLARDALCLQTSSTRGAHAAPE